MEHSVYKVMPAASHSHSHSGHAAVPKAEGTAEEQPQIGAQSPESPEGQCDGYSVLCGDGTLLLKIRQLHLGGELQVS